MQKYQLGFLIQQLSYYLDEIPGTYVVTGKHSYLKNGTWRDFQAIIDGREEYNIAEFTCIDSTLHLKQDLILSDFSKIHLVDCNIKGNKNSIINSDIQETIFENCLFQDFTARTIILDEHCEVTIISHCRFENCGVTKEAITDGGVILNMEEENRVFILDSHFINCFLLNTQLSDGIVYYGPFNRSHIFNCTFENIKSDREDAVVLYFTECDEDISGVPSLSAYLEHDRITGEITTNNRLINTNGNIKLQECETENTNIFKF